MDATDHIDGHARAGLIRQLLGWAAEQPRTYAEAMETWGTACSALPIWEDALAERLIEVKPQPGLATGACPLALTATGRAALTRNR